MAAQEKTSIEKPLSAETKERMQRARATREANKKQEVSLNDTGKAALKMVQNARQSCQILANRLKRGQTVSKEALQACGQLSTELAGLLVG